jgi:hypothetical protein
MVDEVVHTSEAVFLKGVNGCSDAMVGEVVHAKVAAKQTGLGRPGQVLACMHSIGSAGKHAML